MTTKCPWILEFHSSTLDLHFQHANVWKEHRSQGHPNILFTSLHTTLPELKLCRVITAHAHSSAWCLLCLFSAEPGVCLVSARPSFCPAWCLICLVSTEMYTQIVRRGSQAITRGSQLVLCPLPIFIYFVLIVLYKVLENTPEGLCN